MCTPSPAIRFETSARKRAGETTIDGGGTGRTSSAGARVGALDVARLAAISTFVAARVVALPGAALALVLLAAFAVVGSWPLLGRNVTKTEGGNEGETGSAKGADNVAPITRARQ